MAKQEITITVDTNDADYITKVSEIYDKDFNKILPLIEAIKNFKPYKGKSRDYGIDWNHNYNYHVGEYVRKDLGEKSVTEIYPDISEKVHELFQQYCPYSENGFHTIESILISPLVEKTRLL